MILRECSYEEKKTWYGWKTSRIGVMFSVGSFFCRFARNLERTGPQVRESPSAWQQTMKNLLFVFRGRSL